MKEPPKIKIAKIINIIALVILGISLVFYFWAIISFLVDKNNGAEFIGIGLALFIIIYIIYGSICNSVVLILNLISFFFILNHRQKVPEERDQYKKVQNRYLIQALMMILVEIIEFALLIFVSNRLS